MARRYWYAYISPGDIFDPASYRLLSTTPPCNTGTTICAIYAPAGDINPVISSNLSLYAANSIGSNAAQPTGTGRKKYLYKRST